MIFLSKLFGDTAMELPIQRMNPVVLRAYSFSSFNTGKSLKMAQRTVYDYEFEYFTRSDGGIMIDGKYVEFKKGQINIRKPGQIVRGVPPYDCYGICVDFSGNFRRNGNYVFGSGDEAQPLYKNGLIQSMPDKLIPSDPKMILNMFEKIVRGFHTSNELNFFKMSSALYILLGEIFTDSRNTQTTSKNKTISKAIDYIKQNFTSNILVEELIEGSGYSKGHFHHLFKKQTDTTPLHMITELRMEKAKDLLRLTNNEISEIGHMCGYDDNVYFTRQFKKVTGLTPSSYRKIKY